MQTTGFSLKKWQKYSMPAIFPSYVKESKTLKEAHFVQECGISYMQGFYYGRPVPFDIFEKKYMIPQPAYLAFHTQ